MKQIKPLKLKRLSYKYPTKIFNLTNYIVSWFKENPNGNLDEVAQRLGISNSQAFTLYYRAKKNKLI